MQAAYLVALIATFLAIAGLSLHVVRKLLATQR